MPTIDELIGASLAVATVVTSLFLALITAERRGELARLRAFGVPAWRIAGGLVLQGEAAVAVGVAAGYAGAFALLDWAGRGGVVIAIVAFLMVRMFRRGS